MSLDHGSFEAGIEAFRGATAHDADGRATRARVLEAAARSARHHAWRRRATLALALGVAAALSGSAAWTAVGSWRAARPATALGAVGSSATGAASAWRAPGGGGPAKAPERARAFSLVLPPVPANERATRGAADLSPGGRGAPEGEPRRSSGAEEGGENGEARAYGRAHAAHFLADDPPHALALWDAYLRAYPAGTFVPEARFNRALCLLRLGRRDTARQALQSFAAGAYGGYRQRDAETLLDWTAATSHSGESSSPSSPAPARP